MDDAGLGTARIGGDPLESARALLRKGQTLAAIPLIEQAMAHHPEAAAELMAEAEAQIRAIQEVIQRAVAGNWSTSGHALGLAKRAANALAQIAAQIPGKAWIRSPRS